MIALALAATLASASGTHAYRVAVSGPSGSSVVIAAKPPQGWTAAFCSARACAVGHVPVKIGAAGTSYVELHLYPADHPSRGVALVTASGDTLRITL
ncbi:MAG TPA: hypothetical protein VGK84_02585 [Candidatus Tumulicola sp.]